MTRRRALTGIAAFAAWIVLTGQQAARRWQGGHGGDLVLHSNDQDLGSGEVAVALANQLGKILPESGARAVREPDAARIASVMSMQQSAVAVIAYDLAQEMYRGAAQFQAVGPIELRVLVENYKYQVVCRAEFDRNNAYLIVQALMKDPEPLKLTVPDRPVDPANRNGIPAHPGALSFLNGESPDIK